MKICEEREKRRRLIEQSRRRKAIRNTNKPIVRQKETLQPKFIGSLSPLRKSSDKIDYIPSIYSIFPASPPKVKELTQSEKTRMQTESSCLRRKSILVKRVSPTRLISTEKISAKIVEEESFKKLQKNNKRRYAHILPNVLGQTESSFNRVNCDSSPSTPDFFQTEPRSKIIRWNFLKTTASFENYKQSKMTSSAKSTVFSALSSRTAYTPNNTRSETMQIKRNNTNTLFNGH